MELTTELQAVNAILRAIGEAPVDTLDDQDLVDAYMAHDTLREVTREVLSMGWAINEVHEYELKPDNDNEIPLPSTLLWLSAKGSQYGGQVVPRGKRLYNSVKGTYKFDGKVKVYAVFMLDWDEIPEPFRRFITMRAARRFAQQVLGSNTVVEFAQADESNAMIECEQMDAEMRNYSAKESYNIWKMTDGRNALKTGVL